MDFRGLLGHVGIDPGAVLMLRHRPKEPALSKVLPWLAAEHHDLFNAYQRANGPAVERSIANLAGRGVIASFIGMQPAKAVFVGLYDIGPAPRTIAIDRFNALKEMKELRRNGMDRTDQGRGEIKYFQLNLRDEYADWKGRLEIDWPGGERSWWRRAHQNTYVVQAVHPESLFNQMIPAWHEIVLTWQELQTIPEGWKSKLAEWRGVYLIRDQSDGKQYVGSAYGSNNLHGRWLQYAKTGHGGNRWLKQRDPNNFVFSIIQRTSPDLEAESVIRIEQSWKNRLHTHHPDGLNDN